MTALTVLKAARAKVAAGWTQGAYARAADGIVTNAESQEATCWCSWGALFAAGPMNEEGLHSAVGVCAILLSRTAGLSSSGWLADWNDAPGRTQAEVLAAFDRAIALAEGA